MKLSEKDLLEVENHINRLNLKPETIDEVKNAIDKQRKALKEPCKENGSRKSISCFFWKDVFACKACKEKFESVFTSNIPNKKN